LDEGEKSNYNQAARISNTRFYLILDWWPAERRDTAIQTGWKRRTAFFAASGQSELTLLHLPVTRP
jgi:hypothetical protein